MAKPSIKEFSWLEGLSICLAYIAIQLSSEVITGWGTYFYSPEEGGRRIIYVSIGLVAIMFVFGRIFDAFTDPLIGLWSDKTSSKPGRGRLVPISGRRRPFIFWGSILMTATSIVFWFPPVEGDSIANLVYGTAIVSLHWGFFTLFQVPLDSLCPELSRSQRGRIHMGQWRAAGLIIGLAAAAILPGILIEALDPAAHSGGPASAAGYRRMAIVFALVSLLFVQFAVWNIRERYDTAAVVRRSLPLQEIKEAITNTVFLRYIGAFWVFNLGYLAVQKTLPFWVRLGVGGTEETVSAIMLPFIIAALISALLITPMLSRFLTIKWMFVASLTLIALSLPPMYFVSVMDATPDTKTKLAAAMFSISGIGQGMQYALLTPLIGESIDLDAQRSGERREAVYNGLFGIAWKSSQAMSVLVATQTMAWLGNTAANPLGVYLIGPIAGVFALFGIAVALSYPVLHIVPETAGDLPADDIP